MLRRLLREQAVERERVTVLSRGGAGAWYGDIAEHTVEILDLVTPDQYVEALTDRRRRVGDAKQFFPDPFDTKLAELALAEIGDAVVVHPLLMFSRMRFLLEGLQAAEQAPALADYEPLDAGDRALPAGCPADYVAVKLYFSDCFPDGGPARELATHVLERLAGETDVVVLTSGRQLDEHREWVPEGARMHDSSAWMTPQDNLAVQTALVARARALVSTYGGFSYLGPLLGVPTLALQTQEPFNTAHLGGSAGRLPGRGLRRRRSRGSRGGRRLRRAHGAGVAVIVQADDLPSLAGRVTMVSGGFDPLHPGHVAYFRAASELGLPLLCNVSPDDWVTRKHPPLLTQAERLEVIDAIRFVDYTHAEETSTEDVLARLRPRFFAKGADWRDRLPEGERVVCAENGVEVVFLDTVIDSSTDVLRRYRERMEG